MRSPSSSWAKRRPELERSRPGPAGTRPEGSARIGAGGRMPTVARILLVIGLSCLCGIAVSVPRTAFAEDADAYYKQGLAYKQEGKPDQAIDALERAVAAN